MQIETLYETTKMVANPVFDGRAAKGLRSKRFIPEGTRYCLYANPHGIIVRTALLMDGDVLSEAGTDLAQTLKPISDEVEPLTFDEIMITTDTFYSSIDDSLTADVLRRVIEAGHLTPLELRALVVEVMTETAY